jgi:hypothetical protein
MNTRVKAIYTIYIYLRIYCRGVNFSLISDADKYLQCPAERGIKLMILLLFLPKALRN